MSAAMKFLFLLVGFMLAFALAILPSVEKIKETERKAQVMIGGQIILAEIAKTQREKERGLMGVKYMRANEGMLFTYKEKGRHSFWMKGMKIPIDIVWIADKKIVGYEEYVFPEPDKKISELKIYKPPEPVDMVLEIRAGRFGQLKADVGDGVEVKTIVPGESLTSMLSRQLKSRKLEFN